MFFSIAPQTIPMPDGSTLVFAVDPVDSSLVTVTAAGHVHTFKRNGALLSSTPIPDPTPMPLPPVPPIPMEQPAPLAGYASVDDDAVRVDDKPAA